MDTPETDHTVNRRGRAFFWGGILLGILVLLLLLTHGFGLFNRPPTPEEPPPVVHQNGRLFVPENSLLRRRLTVAAAQTEEASASIRAPGIVEADPARTISVLPAGAGRVRELKVALGDQVKQGQLLALIDSPDLAQAYSDNDKAAAAATLATKNLKYQEAQFQIGAAAQRDLDAARNDDAQAAAEYTRSRERLRAMGADADARGEARLMSVRAPRAGSIIAVTTAPGTTINDATQPIMTLADLSVVWVTALVAEKDVGSVQPHQSAQITLDAFPGKALHGTVLFVSNVMEADSRRNKTRIAFENTDLMLKPNMFASVLLQTPAQQRVILPSSALLMNNDRTTVFVATAPWTFERRTVEPLLDGGPRVVIVSGVRPGEQVVVEGGILLND